MSDLPIGTIVEIPAGRGVVRFTGPTSFSTIGKWVGVELYEPKGKNDGSVGGVVYFTCKMGYGMFVRPSQVKATFGMEKVVEEPPTPRVANAPSASRASFGHQRNPSLTRVRTTSVRSGTVPSLTPSPRSASPAKPSTSILPASSTTLSRSLSNASRSSQASPTKRSPKPTVTSTPALLQPRKSVSLRQSSSQEAYTTSYNTNANGATLENTPHTRIASPSSPQARRTSSPLAMNPPTSGQNLQPPSQPVRIRKVSLISSPPPTVSNLSPSTTTPPSASTSPIIPKAQSPSSMGSPVLTRLTPPLEPPEPPDRPPDTSTQTTSISNQSTSTLLSRIRLVESQRAADQHTIQTQQNRINELESVLSKLRPTLTEKIRSQAAVLTQQSTTISDLRKELAEVKRELSDARQEKEVVDARVEDLSEQMEMTMLDREVAEEKAEVAMEESRELRERMAVLEVELNVLRSGASQGGEGTQNREEGQAVKDNLAYIQLEKQNERLKEALLKLRDISQESERDQRRKIAELEKDLNGLDDLQTQYESTLTQLTNAEILIDDLKAQLDAASGADELLVQLTERNEMLDEKIQEMRITIEDLEALKELNDELEENHIETEKAMQEDLDMKDAQNREYARKIEELEEACEDLENTITQFRELVMQLQSELEVLRTQTHAAQTESDRAASQTAAMMSLNLKLQSSASKNQARNIELELRRLEAREAKELLSIVQPYLPQMYLEQDSDATSCYLFFQRLASKADLMSSVVAQAHGLPDSLNGPVADVLVGVCEMRGRIASLSTLCKRFASILRHCDVESFLSLGRLYPELAPLEKRIDMHIDLLRRDEFREMECVSDVVRILSQFDHLAESYFTGYEHDLGEREVGQVLLLDHDLDFFVASIGLTKSAVQEILKDEDAVLDMGGLDIEYELLGPLQKSLDQCKSAKSLSKKLNKRIEDLLQDSAALQPHLLTQMKILNDMALELVGFGVSLAQQIMPHVNDARSAKAPFKLPVIMSYVKHTAASTVAKDRKHEGQYWHAIQEAIDQLIQEAAKLLPLTMEAENVVKVTGVPPWTIRVDEIKASLAVNIEAERKVAQLNDELQGLVRTLKAKDQNIQEKVVKIELMERRMEAVKKQADTIADLESQLSKAKKQERDYAEAMVQLQADLDELEQDNAKLKSLTAGQDRVSAAAAIPETETVPVEGSLETSHLLEQIDALRGTVRFLRTENSYLKGQDLLRELVSLPPIPEPVSREPTPELDPSGLSDSDEESDSPPTPPTLRSLATQTKLLYRDVIKFSSSPRVVDLSAIYTKRAEAHSGKVWLPKKKLPAYQVWERKMEAERLSRRVQGLLDQASAVPA